MGYSFGGNMKEFAVIPITKMELVKAIFVIAFIAPPIVALGIGTLGGLAVLMFWMFPLMFVGMFKDELGWDFHIKIKFFEDRD